MAFSSILRAYLKGRIASVLAGLASLCILAAVFSLYALPWEPLGYGFLLTGVFVLSIGIIDFIKFYNKHTVLNRLRNSAILSDYAFPAAQNLIEQDYQELVKAVDDARRKIIDEKDFVDGGLLHHVRQIKTPIAAMRLLLQSEQSEQTRLLEQLFKVEQYVEMVLQYLRLESISSDLVLKEHSLDTIVKQAVRKYSNSFIRKKIKLNYAELNHNVLTDEKWLVFVIEQILSNALKYTDSGEISIYMDDEMPDTLVIEDTGIGIAEEDLPRVFERGFTGYTGRIDKKATGIGLFLCKQILDRLSHTITIESQVGEGTKVRIGLGVIDIDKE